MKHIKLLLLINIFFQLNYSYAQKDSVVDKKFDRFYISLSGGIGIPVGSFAKKENIPELTPSIKWPASFNMAGPAQFGIEGRLTLNYFISKQFGFIAMFNLNRFRTGEKTILDIAPYSFFENYQSSEYSYEAKAYTVQGYMIGIAARLPINKSCFTFKLLGGVQHSVLPQTHIFTTYSLDNDQLIFKLDITQSSASSTNFAWNAGVEYSLKLSNRIRALCNADFISSSTAEYEGKDLVSTQEYVINQPDIYQFDSVDSYQHTKKISYISANAGIAYIFK